MSFVLGSLCFVLGFFVKQNTWHKVQSTKTQTGQYKTAGATCYNRLTLSRQKSIAEEQEVFLKHIQKKGLKRTAQRDLILEIFLRTEDHLSSEDLYQIVKKQDPTVGQTTVYRTLKLLAEAGLAREVRFGDNRTHYEHKYKHPHHDHMICLDCGKIIEFFSAELEAIQDEMAAKHKFEITEHLLRIVGVCVECRRAKKQQPTEVPAPPPRLRQVADRVR